MTLDSTLKDLLWGNALGFSVISFASYFDVYSHRYIFVGVDPWYNPAHLLLYLGFIVVLLATIRAGRVGLAPLRLAWVGIAIVLSAVIFNEFWHRVLLFGNPLPEPFPIEPPHALLAVGFAACGVAALEYPIGRRFIERRLSELSVSFLSGSLWLIVAGSFFYLGNAYNSYWAHFTAVVFASFSSSLFLRYPSLLTRRFGFATISYLWFIGVNYVFFVRIQEGLPLGLLVVVAIDYIMTVREGANGRMTTVIVAFLLATLYGLVYYPLLPVASTFAVNSFILASAFGVTLEMTLERIATRRIQRTSFDRQEGTAEKPFE